MACGSWLAVSDNRILPPGIAFRLGFRPFAAAGGPGGAGLTGGAQPAPVAGDAFSRSQFHRWRSRAT